jgi:hypothetical protein
MDIHLPDLLEWQRHWFAKVEASLAAGDSLLMLNVGRQAGKTSGLLLWSLVWPHGALAGGSIAFCAQRASSVLRKLMPL